MTEVIIPGRLFGTVAAPPSKSHLQRLIAIAALAHGESRISGYAPSSDVDAAISVARELGAVITVRDTEIIITKGVSVDKAASIHCGESGLAARMFSAIAALSPQKTIVTGEGSLLKRPFGMVHEALSQLGKTVTLTDGRLPMEISGAMLPSEICIDGSDSSQLLTGLLIALPMLSGRSIIHVNDLQSRPYVQMTIDTLAQFGIQIQQEGFRKFVVEGDQRPKPRTLIVEGDWSGAAFLLVGGAIAGEVTVTGLNPRSSQADRAILDVLETVGAEVEVQGHHVTVKRNRLQPFYFDATDCPDLFPPLAALAAYCDGKSSILGTHRLRHKESDRAATITSVLRELGIAVSLADNAMHIIGAQATGGTVTSHNDHRIAMMAATLGCMAAGAVNVTDADAVNKSYPDFFLDVASLASDSR
jgi:3-phosphoshikimate 1-carboxyvinyltransferase